VIFRIGLDRAVNAPPAGGRQGRCGPAAVFGPAERAAPEHAAEKKSTAGSIA
jgi:hypothetical protein